ncbi:MAG: hypothetical protein RLZZ171_2589 [Cyanobacteriota bacterium]|jgi:hypothetical protein
MMQSKKLKLAYLYTCNLYVSNFIAYILCSMSFKLRNCYAVKTFVYCYNSLHKEKTIKASVYCERGRGKKELDRN